MIQSTYTSVSNATITPCDKKGCIISSEPIPLLRNNYLGEYRTELEKAKVRKNLGIIDNRNIAWGDLGGDITNLPDLMQLMDNKWNYVFDDSIGTLEQIKTILDAVNYAIKYVSLYENNTEDVAALKTSLERLTIALSELSSSHTQDIETISTSIESINSQISEINTVIVNIDSSIATWILNHLSDTIIYNEDKLEVVISLEKGNILKNNSGLYVDDIYRSGLSLSTTSSLVPGLTVGDILNLPFSVIIDDLFFPASVKELIYPSLSYSSIPRLVEVGSRVTKPKLNYNPGDAGEKLSETEIIKFNGTKLDSEPAIYDKFGTYTYEATVTYAEGKKLINNRGEETNLYVRAGSKGATISVNTTYPIYYGSAGNVSKHNTLIAFNSKSSISITLPEVPEILIPGKNSKIESFIADTGAGWASVNMDLWTREDFTLHNITYLRYTKKDTYPDRIPHELTLTLKL